MLPATVEKRTNAGVCSPARWNRSALVSVGEVRCSSRRSRARRSRGRARPRSGMRSWSKWKIFSRKWKSSSRAGRARRPSASSGRRRSGRPGWSSAFGWQTLWSDGSRRRDELDRVFERAGDFDSGLVSRHDKPLLFHGLSSDLRTPGLAEGGAADRAWSATSSMQKSRKMTSSSSSKANGARDAARWRARRGGDPRPPEPLPARAERPFQRRLALPSALRDDAPA